MSQFMDQYLQIASMIILFFMVVFALLDIKVVTRVLKSIFEGLYTCVIFPIELIQDQVNDYINYARNIRLYKMEKKKNEYWELVP